MAGSDPAIFHWMNRRIIYNQTRMRKKKSVSSNPIDDLYKRERSVRDTSPAKYGEFGIATEYLFAFDGQRSPVLSVGEKRRKARRVVGSRLSEREEKFTGDYEVKAALSGEFSVRSFRRRFRLGGSANKRPNQIAKVRERLRSMNIRYKLKIVGRVKSSNYKNRSNIPQRRTHHKPHATEVMFETYTDYLVAMMSTTDTFVDVRIKK